MQLWFPVTALGVALTISVAVPSADARGAVGGASPGMAAGFHGHGFRFHPGFGFRPRFFRPGFPIRQPQLNFGASFVSHQRSVVTGGYGDDYDSGDDYGSDVDDIGDLHFRVQEPFGPGDIGPPPARPEGDEPYMSDQMGPSRG